MLRMFTGTIIALKICGLCSISWWVIALLFLVVWLVEVLLKYDKKQQLDKMLKEIENDTTFTDDEKMFVITNGLLTKIFMR